MNPWEIAAMQAAEDGQSGSDPLIYPGLYSPSGFDMLEILFRVTGRPNPQVELGAVDASCAIIVCDLSQPDEPIVYASDPFLELTGYECSEILGRNCRFLQAPGGERVRKGSTRRRVPKDIVRRMRKSIDRNQEIQLEVPNYRKDGTAFINILAIIPICWDDPSEFRYSVGFLCAK